MKYVTAAVTQVKVSELEHQLVQVKTEQQSRVTREPINTQQQQQEESLAANTQHQHTDNSHCTRECLPSTHNTNTLTTLTAHVSV